MSKPRQFTAILFGILILAGWSPVRGADGVRSRHTAHVHQMVPGLYESIPAQKQLTCGNVKILGSRNTFHGSYELRLTATDAAGKTAEGFISRLVTQAPRGNKHILKLENTHLISTVDGQERRIPKFIELPGSIPLVPGRGIPTIVAGTLQILRIHNVPLGGLSKMTSYISNLKTMVEVMTRPEAIGLQGRAAEALLESRFLKTQSGRYFETIATQSGHQIGKITVSLDSVEEHSVAYMTERFPWVRDRLQQAGFNKESLALPYFNVELQLSPLK